MAATVGERFFPPTPMPPMIGAQRVALHSLFRIICEANQLMVNHVIADLSVPLVGTSPERARKLVKSLHLIDAGSVQSSRLVEYLQQATGLGGLSALTLHDLSHLQGVGSLWTRPYRKWCPHCYQADALEGLPPYDRLLWSIDLVRRCPVHEVSLSSTCPKCGKGRAPHLFGRDISGFCPRCLEWLGRKPDPWRGADDDQGRHAKWVACSFADLLESTPPANTDLFPNIQISIRKLAEMHHGGKMAHLARQIRRNKSVISTWLSRGSRIGWDALCDISYVYQQPLHQLLRGDVAEITLLQPLTLPSAIRPRQGRHRKQPTVRDPTAISAFMTKVAEGTYPSITSVRGAAGRLGMDVREAYRIAPDATKVAAAAIQTRKTAERAVKTERRSKSLDAAVQAVSARLAEQGTNVTRRLMDEELIKQGLRVKWAESKRVLALIRHYTAVAEAGLHGLQSTDSGNS